MKHTFELRVKDCSYLRNSSSCENEFRYRISVKSPVTARCTGSQSATIQTQRRIRLYKIFPGPQSITTDLIKVQYKRQFRVQDVFS